MDKQDKQDKEKQTNEQTAAILQDEMNFNTPDFAFVPKKEHGWKQQGCYLVCHSCDLEHAIYIGMGKMMVGIDQETHEPILEKRV